jgi:hypothetical protein
MAVDTDTQRRWGGWADRVAERLARLDTEGREARARAAAVQRAGGGRCEDGVKHAGTTGVNEVNDAMQALVQVPCPTFRAAPQRCLRLTLSRCSNSECSCQAAAAHADSEFHPAEPVGVPPPSAPLRQTKPDTVVGVFAGGGFGRRTQRRRGGFHAAGGRAAGAAAAPVAPATRLLSPCPRCSACTSNPPSASPPPRQLLRQTHMRSRICWAVRRWRHTKARWLRGGPRGVTSGCTEKDKRAAGKPAGRDGTHLHGNSRVDYPYAPGRLLSSVVSNSVAPHRHSAPSQPRASTTDARVVLALRMRSGRRRSQLGRRRRRTRRRRGKRTRGGTRRRASAATPR